MSETYFDVNGKEYTLDEVEKIVPQGCYCYTPIKYPCKENGFKYETKLCPFLDWLKQNDIQDYYDYQQTGYCHFLKLGDWFDKDDGKEEEIIHLERYNKVPIKVNSKQNGTMLLWDACKECGINDEIDLNDLEDEN